MALSLQVCTVYFVFYSFIYVCVCRESECMQVSAHSGRDYMDILELEL